MDQNIEWSVHEYLDPNIYMHYIYLNIICKYMIATVHDAWIKDLIFHWIFCLHSWSGYIT